jgi:DNA invertase Pin-like site-specific DNA recombinase
MAPHKGKFVSYLRVSTDKQGRSGLGLEAQRAAVEQFLNGGTWTLVEEYVEVESGKRTDNRPQLDKALQHAKVTGATLVIAKLDRLSRDAHFLLGLQKAGVKFTCADMPDANNLTVGIMALVAQQEREAISRRTKEALAAAKARGVKLGNPNGAAHLRGRGNREAVAAIRGKATEWAEERRSVVEDIQASGITSVRGIAAELNNRGILTPLGGQWHPTSTARLLKRLQVAQ